MPKFRVYHIVTFSKVIEAPSADAAEEITVESDEIAGEENGWNVENTDIESEPEPD